MASYLSKPSTCSDCKQPMPVGTHVRGSGPYRHYGSCPTPAEIAALPGSATPKQVDYAQVLQRQFWTPAVFGRAEFSVEEFRAMSKNKISDVIDALLAERDLATGN